MQVPRQKSAVCIITTSASPPDSYPIPAHQSLRGECYAVHVRIYVQEFFRSRSAVRRSWFRSQPISFECLDSIPSRSLSNSGSDGFFGRDRRHSVNVLPPRPAAVSLICLRPHQAFAKGPPSSGSWPSPPFKNPLTQALSDLLLMTQMCFGVRCRLGRRIHNQSRPSIPRSSVW